MPPPLAARLVAADGAVREGRRDLLRDLDAAAVAATQSDAPDRAPRRVAAHRTVGHGEDRHPAGVLADIDAAATEAAVEDVVADVTLVSVSVLSSVRDAAALRTEVRVEGDAVLRHDDVGERERGCVRP